VWFTAEEADRLSLAQQHRRYTDSESQPSGQYVDEFLARVASHVTFAPHLENGWQYAAARKPTAQQVDRDGDGVAASLSVRGAVPRRQGYAGDVPKIVPPIIALAVHRDDILTHPTVTEPVDVQTKHVADSNQGPHAACPALLETNHGGLTKATPCGHIPNRQAHACALAPDAFTNDGRADARKDFNWLRDHAALARVPDLVRFVKGRYNVDDARVYLAGHSDGARATFWMATHQPQTLAAYLGLNYYPRSLLGYTAVANLCCGAPFFGISGAEDAGFDAGQVTAVVRPAERSK
jgi:hypothetical protein